MLVVAEHERARARRARRTAPPRARGSAAERPRARAASVTWLRPALTRPAGPAERAHAGSGSRLDRDRRARRRWRARATGSITGRSSGAGQPLGAERVRGVERHPARAAPHHAGARQVGDARVGCRWRRRAAPARRRRPGTCAAGRAGGCTIMSPGADRVGRRPSRTAEAAAAQHVEDLLLVAVDVDRHLPRARAAPRRRWRRSGAARRPRPAAGGRRRCRPRRPRPLDVSRWIDRGRRHRTARARRAGVRATWLGHLAARLAELRVARTAQSGYT